MEILFGAWLLSCFDYHTYQGHTSQRSILCMQFLLCHAQALPCLSPTPLGTAIFLDFGWCFDKGRRGYTTVCTPSLALTLALDILVLSYHV